MCLETQEPVSHQMKYFPGPRCPAPVLALLEFGGRHESFEFAGSTYERIKSLRAASTHGYTGSFVRRSGVTCGGVSSKRI